MPEHPQNGHSPASPTGQSQLPPPVKEKVVPPDKLLLGAAALAGWVLLFAAGLLIETVEYRLILAPRSVSKQLGLELSTVPGDHADALRSASLQRQAKAQNASQDVTTSDPPHKPT